MAQSTTAVYCIVSRAPNYWSSAFVVVVPNAAHTLKNVSRRNRAVGSRWPRVEQSLYQHSDGGGGRTAAVDIDNA